MNPRINQLVRSLLAKDTLEQCSLPELQQFAERHPYFGAAQLLLTKKMQTDSPDRYNEQLQKTLLFFHNPIWVEHLLNDTGNAEVIKIKKDEAVTDRIVIAVPEPVTEVIPSAETAEVLTNDELSQQTETGSTVIPDVLGTVKEDIPLSTAAAVNAEVEPQQSDVETREFVEAADDAIPPGSTEVEVPLNIPALKIEAVNSTKDELVFEPYHTVDYFASQGIKFKEEEKPADKFGQQLKSFTEWLKTLKKVQPSEIAATTGPALEKKVEELAEVSITDREVVTETMAGVWEKQGNLAKAIEVYSKLSLLEPSKSTYFAAKIEDLKKQS